MGGLGLIGSDAWSMQSIDIQSQLQRKTVLTLFNVRFALAALACKANETEDKYKAGKALLVGASYPSLATQALGLGTNVLRVGGGEEALPALMPELDGIFVLVDTGKTIEENDLVVIADNLTPVTLDAIWSTPVAQSATI